ncbi:DMT family transporter [Hoeflea poritis]|uniref:DMT family transporter n=1 Tax=Hoeflea poritis TaxID=2993659 RepID=A0ABT4VN26_9HYPH|nr:DMT family transporter [Hoeflea poritis]MDA4846091.1 DMT family transporter [Hoeflea poritis]
MTGLEDKFSTLRAVLWTLLAALVFTLIFASGKFVGAEVDAVQIVFMRYLGAAVVIGAAVLWIHRGFAPVRSDVPGLHLARAVSGVSGEICIISAPLFMAYEDATSISLTNGVIAMLLAIVLLKERAGPMHWFAAMTCLLGAILIVRSQAESAAAGSNMLGIGIAVSGAVLSGAELFFIKLLTGRERPMVIMLYVNVLAVIMLAVPALLLWRPMHGADLVWLLSIGPLALFGQYCWIRAFQNADAVIVVPVGYAAIPFSAILGIVAFHQGLGAVQVTGAMLVLAGGVLLARLPATRETAAGAE